MTKNQNRKRKQEFVGEVVKNQMSKTISVLVYRSFRQKKYGKYLKKGVIFKVHDEKNQAQVGDKVRIFEVRPMSKTKRWMLSQIVKKQETSS